MYKMMKSNDEKYKINRRQVFMLVVFLTSLLMHTILNIFIKNPWAMGDEIGTLATGAHFAGYDWRSALQSPSDIGGGVNYYGGGFGIVFTPFFYLIKGRPYLLYQCILFVCSVLHSIIAPVSYFIMDEFFEIHNKTFLYIASLASSFFVFSRSTNAMNENALILCTWLTVMFSLMAFNTESQKKKSLYSVVLAFILGYSYTIHTRMIILAISFVLVLFLIKIISNKKIVNFKIFLISSIAFYYLASIFNKYIIRTVFIVGMESKIYNTSGTATNSVISQFVLLFKDGYWRAFFDILTSNLFSLSIVTLNLFFIALLIWFYKMVCAALKKKTEFETETELYNFVIVGGIVFIAVLGMIFLYSIQGLGNAVSAIRDSGITRSYIYLRYPGAFCGPLIVLISVIISKHICKIKTICFSLFLFLLSFVYVNSSILSRISNKGDEQFDYYHFLSPFSWINQSELYREKNIYFITALITLVYLIIAIIAMKRKSILFIAIISLTIIYQYGYLALNYDKIYSSALYDKIDSIVLLYYDNPIVKKCINNSTIYVPLSYNSWETPYLLQYYFPDAYIVKEKPSKNANGIIMSKRILDREELEEGYSEVQLDDELYIYTNRKQIIKELSE